MSTLIDSMQLRRLRETRGWDQHTLADRAGIDPSVVSRLERGLQIDTRLSVVLAIARALEMPLDELLVVDYRTARTQYPALAAELAVAIADLATRPLRHQQQVAAIIQGYLSVPLDG